MYQNIVSGYLKLPTYLSHDACSLIMSLMNRHPSKRLGAGKEDAEEVKRHAWFSNIDWTVAQKRGLKVPKPDIWIIPEGHIDSSIFGPPSTDNTNIKDWEYVSKI